jgi:hypothetical protein
MLLVVGCGGGGDTNTTSTTSTQSTSVVDESCWQKAYNECTAVGNGAWTCNDFANKTCTD